VSREVGQDGKGTYDDGSVPFGYHVVLVLLCRRERGLNGLRDD
jgi:hypothetical protein